MTALDRPQRRRRRGVRPLVARRRRRADADHHVGQRRLRVPCRRPVDDPSHVCAAVAHGVAIGAQVSYPDLAGFGRRFIEIDPAELTDAVLYQIGALEVMARVAGARVAYVKPHGALYNAIVHHEAQAAAVVEALVRPRRRAGRARVCPTRPSSAAADDRGLRFVAEGFADRGYRADGTLVPRGQPGRAADRSGGGRRAGARAGRRAGCGRSASTATLPAPPALATAVAGHARRSSGWARRLRRDDRAPCGSCRPVRARSSPSTIRSTR